MDGGGVLSLEAGTADIEGPVFQTGIGRVQLIDVKRPWARANYSMNHWNFLAYYTARDAEGPNGSRVGRQGGPGHLQHHR